MWPVPSSPPPPPPPCRPGGVGPPASAGKPHSPRLVLPSTARSMMVGRVFLVLTGACQFGHGVGGFTTNFIHSLTPTEREFPALLVVWAYQEKPFFEEGSFLFRA